MWIIDIAFIVRTSIISQWSWLLIKLVNRSGLHSTLIHLTKCHRYKWLGKHWDANYVHSDCIKIHGRVSVAKKAVWHTSVLLTGTVNSPFSTPCISKITWLISIKCTYFMPSIYANLHTKFERNLPSSSRDMWSWKLPHFLHLFLLFLHTVLQK